MDGCGQWSSIGDVITGTGRISRYVFMCRTCIWWRVVLDILTLLSPYHLRRYCIWLYIDGKCHWLGRLMKVGLWYQGMGTWIFQFFYGRQDQSAHEWWEGRTRGGGWIEQRMKCRNVFWFCSRELIFSEWNICWKDSKCDESVLHFRFEGCLWQEAKHSKVKL